MSLPRALVPLLVLGLAASARAAEPDAKGVEFFERKVRPILAERCYGCHSAQAKKVRGGLLLDTREGWAKGGDTGPAIVPGDPGKSLLVQAIQWTDETLQMPPKGKLPPEEVAILLDWVKRGAPDPRHGGVAAKPRQVIDIEAARRMWAFQPLKPAAPPKVTNESWPRNPVDRFILAKLEEKGIAPNATAAKRTLIRRAYLDLIGIPPTPEEVEAFVNDGSNDAFERAIDHLLASPHYGERWGRHWLDLARFAESHGFEHDYDRPTAYHYRDFVIEALNRDLPYDTFVQWQIAGDELAPSDNLALKATGFLAAGVHSTQITANQVEKERYDELDDIVNTIGTSMLGLTIGCARCHDHKFDPIPQKDYYRLLSTFTTTVRTEYDLKIDPEGDAKALAAYEREHAPLVAALQKFEAEQLPARFEEWEKTRPESPGQPAWVVLDLAETRSQGGAAFKKQDDGSYLASGKNVDFDTYRFVAHVDLKGITGLKIEALADPSMVKGGPGRAANGNFDLTQVTVTAGSRDGKSAAETIVLQNPKATFEQPGLPIAAAIDDNPKSGWAVDPQFGKNHAAVFEFGRDISFEGGTTLTITLVFNGNNMHNIGRPRLSVTTAPRPVGLDGNPTPLNIAQALKTPRSERKADQTAALLTWYRAIDPEWQKLNKAVGDHAAKAPKPSVVKALISSEGLPAVRLHTQGGDFLEKTHFLKRGDPNQKLEEATEAFLSVLTTAPDAEKHWIVPPPQGWRTSYRRRALANWITDVDYGAGNLLARVIVNRLWQHHLGRGIISTPSDFGAQGEKPTHPELVDWLASELIRNGWKLKPLHKLIMLSAVYQEAAELDTNKLKADHDNKLFWHYSRQRLEAEAIRDAMLAVSGLLDETPFGPGTLDEKQKRRSIYFTVKRSKLIPMMVLFDAPDALQGTGLRPSTTIAPQSLMLMNSPIVREWAEGFARRVEMKAKGSVPDAVKSAYLIALGREPTADELTDGTAFIEQQRETYPAKALQPALADFCQVLLSLNEFVFVD